MTGIFQQLKRSPLHNVLMQVSENELYSVLKQAFEGCGFDAGRYENAAQMVLWLQMHGMDGLSLLSASLGQFTNWADQSFAVTESEPNTLLFDMAGQSVLSTGALVSNLVLAKAADGELCIGFIRDVQDHAYIAKQLIDAQSLGLHGLAYWQTRTEALESGTMWQMLRTSVKNDGKKQNTLQELSKDSTEKACSFCPCLETFNFSLQSTDQVGAVAAKDQYQLVLAYAKHRTQLDDVLVKHKEFDKAQLLATTSAAQSREKYQYALNNGIEISTELWQKLVELGNNVLVESNEQSRKGAGA